jgi:hypothetical protein
MHDGDDNDASAAVQAAELVWGELTSEILSHLDAMSLACAASTCKGFHSSLEHAVKARVARSGRLLFDQPRMHEGACYMWRTWAEPGGGCSCAWQLRTGWTAVSHRIDMREMEDLLYEVRASPQATAELMQRWPAHGWTAHSIMATNPTAFAGTERQKVRITKPKTDLDNWSMAPGGSVAAAAGTQLRLPVWMQFHGLPARAEILYQTGRPPVSGTMSNHSRSRSGQRGALLTLAQSHVFMFAPNTLPDDDDEVPREAVLQTIYSTDGALPPQDQLAAAMV